MSGDNSDILERLYAVIESRQGTDAATSYTAKLFAAGMPEIARKVGEEAVETLTAALSEPDNITAESADLLFHLMILWADAGIAPDDVLEELARREGVSGITEKESREP